MGKTTKLARKFAVIGAAFAIGGTVLLAAAPADATTAPTPESGVVGGWTEGQGAFVVGIGVRATANHVGKAESKTISGTSNKRAHGWTTWTTWTTWAGTRHYTTAQLEHYWPASGVIATSGRKYGTGGTEAISPWKAFNPNATSGGNGTARTYYGR
jgi:hypothetical protein